MRHPDFEKIYQAFMWRYCKNQSECELGKNYYYAWLNKMDLDDTKPYEKPQEKFSWVDKSNIAFWKQDEQAKYFKVEALFPLSSMNRNVYTRNELTKACRTLVGRPVNFNHTCQDLPDAEIIDADYEDDTVECILKIAKNSTTLELIEKGDIIHVSIEAQCLRGGELSADGYVCKGLVFTGLALLTRDILPGVPLTRIMPVEKLVESIPVTDVTNLDEEKEKQDTSTQKEKSEENATASQTQDTKETRETHEQEKRKDDIEEYEKASENTSWEFDASKYSIDQLRMAAAVVTDPSGENGQYTKEDCHLPHHLPGDGKTHGGTLIWHGVAAAGAALTGSRGGVQLSSEDKTKAKKHLEKHYSEFDKAPPWNAEEKSPSEKAKDALLPRVEALEKQVAELAGRKEAEQAKLTESKPKTEQKLEQPEILTKDGFWRRFHQLRSEGMSRNDAFRLTSLEIIEAASKLQKK